MKKILFILLASISIVRAQTNTFTENFTGNPATNGWQTFGDASLFQWDSTNHDMIVTWDSTQTNSYFYHSLPTILGLQDAFTMSFDLTLSNAVAGGDYGFELGIGFFNLAEATSTNFVRGTGYQSPDIVEFDYFPPLGAFPASVDASMIDDENDFRFIYDTPSLTNGTTYNVSISHLSGAPFVTAAVSTYDTSGQLQLYTSLPYSYGSATFTDYFVDTFSISSYSDLNADGSILATGTVGNITITTTNRPVGDISVANLGGSLWQAQFTSRSNWNYTLVRTTDFKAWTPVSPATPGTGTYLTLQDTNAPASQAFYRVLASQP